MINNNQAQQEATEGVDSILQQKEFGSVLKNAREAAGITIEEVAEKLLVSIDIIKAIDNSSAEALPALTFTQGYIRSYARILDVSADEIIDAYNSVVPDTKKATTPQSVLLDHKTSSDTVIKFITTGFVLAAIIALSMWLYQTDLGLQLNNNQTGLQHETDTALDDGDRIQAPQPQLEFQSEQQLEQAVIDNAIDHETSQFDASVDDAPVEIAAEQISVEAEEVVEQVQPSKLTVEQKSAEVGNVNSITSTENLITGTDELLLIASGDSWCEIQDANGQRLFYRLLANGDKANVKGTAPFRVFLGNAPEVRVEINQKTVNFDQLINNNSKIANLSIESDAKAVRFRNR